MNNITAILTTYNRKYEVRRALDSIYAQTIRPNEIILIDDHSTDGTKEYIDSFTYEGLRYIYLPNNVGAGAARNCGIESAHNEWIAFLDSDNVWYENKIEEFMPYLSLNVDVVCSKYYKHICFEKQEFPTKLSRTFDDIAQEMLIHSISDASATIYRKEILNRLSGFDSKMVTNIDWELLLRGIRSLGLNIKKIDKVLSENHTMYDSLSENTEVEMRERMILLEQYEEKLFSKHLENEYILSYIQENRVVFEEKDALARFISYVSNKDLWIKSILAYQQNKIVTANNNAYRKSSFYSLLSRWMQIKLDGKTVADNILELGFQSVAIYGAGKHGKFLYQDLKDSKVKIAYMIDRNISAMAGTDVTVYTMEDDLPNVDAVIVTPYLEFDGIRNEIMDKGNYKVLSLDEIVK